MNEYPVSLDEFKSYFLREAGLEYQPYDSWVKTVWDTGDYCLYENIFFKALSDMVHTAPEIPEPVNPDDPVDPDNPDDPVTPDEPVEPEDPVEPLWEQVSQIYEEGVIYHKDDVVFYDGDFYIAVEDTSMVPNTFMGWQIPKLDDLFPGYREWKEPIAYSVDDKVIAIVRYKPGVWVSLVDENYTEPGSGAQVEGVDTWEFSEEDTEEMDDWILDVDILRAMGEAMFKFNPFVYPKDRQQLIFLYLTMFFLVYDRQMAASGMNGNSASGPVTHRTVGKMSVTYMESKLYQKNPSYEFLSLNEYGKKAFNLMAPYLRGGVMTFCGSNTGD